MKTVIFTYTPDLSKKYNQFCVFLHCAQRIGDKWKIDDQELAAHKGDLDYLAHHVADRHRFKMALESEMEFRRFEARSLFDPNHFDLLRIHPNILPEFVTRCQNQGVLTDTAGNPTHFKLTENIIPKLTLHNNTLEVLIGDENLLHSDFIVKFIPVTLVFQNHIFQLKKNIPYGFIKEIPIDRPVSEQQREMLLIQYLNMPDRIRIHSHEKQKIVKGIKNKPILNFDTTLRKAQLFFQYDTVMIPDTEPHEIVYDHEKNIEVHRHGESENSLKDFLKTMGFFLRPKQVFNWFLSSRTLPAVFPFLIQNGLAIQVNHRDISHMPEMTWQISSDNIHIYVGGRVHLKATETAWDDLFSAFQNNQGFFQTPDGSYGLISDEIKRLLQNLTKNGRLEQNRLVFRRSDFSFVDAQFKTMEAVETDADFSRLQAFAQKFESIRHYPVPQTLQPVLREYQVLGYNWLRTLFDLGLSGILSDDMGLGKTLQVLTLLKSLKDENLLARPVLLIVPKTLIFNWENEIQKFTPELSHTVFPGLPGEPAPVMFDQTNLVIATYGQIRQHIDYFLGLSWSYVILDESQAIKNPAAMITKAVKRICCAHKLSITGTPVENSAMDLWSQFDFLMPGFLHSQKIFKRTYSNEIKRLEELHIKTRPYILRRLKRQVAKELPEKSEFTLFCDFTKDQKKAYDRALQFAQTAIAEKETDKTMDILELILRLRQISCHSALVEKQGSPPLTSGKLETVLDRGMEILSEGHKILIFSQFTQHLRLVRKAFDRHKITSFYLDGKTRNRAAVVHQFKSFTDPCPFFISLKTGGTGLNLSEANYVFLLDPWWNPAVENQAIDRCHRIGQTQPVFVYRFITKDSIEEKVNALKEIKQQIEKTVIDESTPEYLSGEQMPMDKETLKQLISK